MFEFYLPHTEKFEKVFLQNEIHEWEAKMFLKKIKNLKGKNSPFMHRIYIIFKNIIASWILEF